jgi:hypothetical protein
VLTRCPPEQTTAFGINHAAAQRPKRAQSRHRLKLCLDFVPSFHLRGAMDDRHDLIDRLCTTAGMIFEDSSVGAISRSVDNEASRVRIENISKAASDASKLAAAALVVLQMPD